MQLRRSILTQCVSIALLAAASTAAWAQTTNATLVGTVTDPQGAATAGANITVKNTATGVLREVRTDQVGNYRVFPLNPGVYDVSAGLAGFKTRVASGIILEVAATVKADFTLEVGQITETVEVSAAATILQTQDASVGGTVASEELKRLPVNGRNYTRLIMLMPGTSDMGGSQTRGTFSGTQLISINGQRRQDNNFTVDGVDNNFMMMNSPGASPPMDSIQEFRVLNNTSAEFGRSAGANVNIAIKSGSRDLHGSLYEYFRNDKLDANDFFQNRLAPGATRFKDNKVPFRQNQYGFALGGPAVLPKIYNGRDKTFWFFNWEGFNSRRGRTALSTTPIAEQRTGDFSNSGRNIYDPLLSAQTAQGLVRQPFAGNRIPASRINPGIKFFIDSMMPLPNQPGSINNYVNGEGGKNDRSLWNVRADHTFNGSNNVFFRYSFQNVSNFTPNANPNIYNEARYDARTMAAAWNHIFSPTSVLEVKFGYNNPSNPGQDYNRKITRGDFIDKSGIKMYQRDVFSNPIPSLSAVGEFGAGGGGDLTLDKVWQGIVNYSKVVGRHSLKMGVNYQHRHFFTNTSNPMNGNGDFDRRLTNSATDNLSGHSFATMLLGFPTEIRRGLGNTLTQGRIFARNFYFQDDWRVSSKLTVNLGMRYEYQNPPYDETDRLGNLWVRRDATSGKYTGTLLWSSVNPELDPVTGQRNSPPKREGTTRGLMLRDFNNFAPRIGIAYQLLPKTVIRTGYGIFYNSTFVQELQDLRKFWPYTVQQVFVANTGLTPDLSITDNGPSFSNTSAIGGWPQNPNNRTPYSQQWNFTIQQQLLNDMSLEVAYIGTSNKKQVGYTALNAALKPGPGDVQPRRLLPEYADLDGGSNEYGSNYHAFQTKLTKRFSRGMQLNMNYTWGRSMDDQSSLAEWKTQDAFNKRADYSRSSIDLRHIFQVAYVYELPFGKGKTYGGNWSRSLDAVIGGWALQGITRIQSGAPINVVVGQDRANVGRTYQRPNVVRNPNIGGFSGRNVDAPWFDPSAFQLQPIYTYGNAGAFIVQADGRNTWDVALEKAYRFDEHKRLELHVEMFNMPNHVNFGNPQGNFASSSFGKLTGATSARQIQLGLRFAF